MAVVGGGITGLGAAYALGKNGALEIEVFEASPRWGGKITTETAGGFLLEGGPDSFLVRKPAGVELARELGLEDELVPTSTKQGQVYLLRRGTLLPLPAGMMLAAPTDLEALDASPILSDEGKRRVRQELEIPAADPADGPEEESLGSFLRRRFGDEALAVLGDPLMGGIHAGDPETLSLRATFPLFAELEQRFGSVIRGLKRIHGGRAGEDGVTRLDGAPPQVAQRVSLRGGLGRLVETLVETLEAQPGVDLHRSHPVTGLEARSEGGARLRFEEGGGRDFDAVILALPAAAAGRLLGDLDPTLGAELRSLPAVSSATVSLGFSANAVDHPLDGLGFVVPRIEGRPLRACTWSSTKFPGRAPHGHVLLRAFVGGAGAEDLVDLDDGALVELALAELRPLLGLRAEPVLTDIYRFPRGIPQFQVGCLDRIASVESRLPPGLHLAGSPYHGLGIPDCLASAQDAARKVLAEIPPAVASAS